MYLEELDDGTGFENKDLECKARLNRDDTVGWLKSVAGLQTHRAGSFTSASRIRQTGL